MKNTGREQLASLLSEGLDALSLKLDAGQRQKLLDYVGLLDKWNRVYNLTAVRDPVRMVTQHVLDSLAALPAFDGARSVLDVGAGGGLPGVVIAIARPDIQVALIDTVQKKTAFLTQVKSELALDNVTVHAGRVEVLQTDEAFDVITSRAFSSLQDFVSLSGHLLQAGGQFVALKGAVPQAEIAQLPAGWRVTEIRPIKVPGLNAERHLILMQRDS